MIAVLVLVKLANLLLMIGIEDLYAQYKKYDEDPKQSPKLFLQSKMERFDITSTPQESLLY